MYGIKISSSDTVMWLKEIRTGYSHIQTHDLQDAMKFETSKAAIKIAEDLQYELLNEEREIYPMLSVVEVEAILVWAEVE